MVDGVAREDSDQWDISRGSFVEILRKYWKGQFFAFPIFFCSIVTYNDAGGEQPMHDHGLTMI